MFNYRHRSCDYAPHIVLALLFLFLSDNAKADDKTRGEGCDVRQLSFRAGRHQILPGSYLQATGNGDDVSLFDTGVTVKL